MATTRLPLSGDSSGKYAPIPITATTNGTAQTLHAATSTSGQADDIWLSLSNTTASPIRVTLLDNGPSEPSNVLGYVDVPPAGSPPARVLDGKPASGGAVLKAYASATGVNVVSHFANRYTAS